MDISAPKEGPRRCKHCGEILPDPPGQGRSKYCPPEKKNCAYEAQRGTQNTRKILSREGLSRRELPKELLLLTVAASGIVAEAKSVLQSILDPRRGSLLDDTCALLADRLWEARIKLGLGYEVFARSESQVIQSSLSVIKNKTEMRLWLFCEEILAETEGMSGSQESIARAHACFLAVKKGWKDQNDFVNLCLAMIKHGNIYRAQPKSDLRAAMKEFQHAYAIAKEQYQKTKREAFVVIMQQAIQWQLRVKAMQASDPDPWGAITERSLLLELTEKVDTQRIWVEALREDGGWHRHLFLRSKRKGFFHLLDRAEDRLVEAESKASKIPPEEKQKSLGFSFPRLGAELYLLREEKGLAREKVMEALNFYRNEYQETYALRQLGKLGAACGVRIDEQVADISGSFSPVLPPLYLEEKLLKKRDVS
jgi:hypothetical protein